MPEDRDQLFEKALARHLRADSAASSPCLDPETLAAYHERALSPAELVSAKSHIVTCVRCQEILAELEITQEVDELRETADLVPGMAVTAETASSGLRPKALPSAEAINPPPERIVAIRSKKFASLRWAAPMGAIAAALLVWIGVRDSGVLHKAPSEAAQISANRRQEPLPPAAEASKQSGPSKEKEAERERQKSDDSSVDALNETAPAPHSLPLPEPYLLDESQKSAAAGRLEQKDQKLQARDGYASSTRTATGAGRGPSAPSAQNQAADALGRRDQSAAGGAAQMAERTAPDVDKAEQRKAAPAAGMIVSGAAKPAAPPLPSKPLPGRLRGTVTDPSGASVSGANVQLQSDSGRTIASTSTDTAGTYSFSGVAEGNYQLQLQSPGFRTDVLTGLNIQAGENVMNAKLELGAASEIVHVAGQAEVVSNSYSRGAELKALSDLKKNSLDLPTASPGVQSVASPDGKALWTFGEAGQIFHSANGGKEWTSQVTGVTVKLLSASAPSAKVCWVGGASGTVLRTTDGGKHWQRITAPTTGDFTRVHSSDAKHASIWEAANRVGYETSDGGKTWKQIASEPTPD